MDGLARMAGAPVFVEIDGRQYELSPLQIKDFGAIEHHLLSKRVNPVEQVIPLLSGLTPDQQKVLLQEAYRELRATNKVPASEVAKWMDSMDGVGFTIWLCLRKKHPEMTLERIEAWVQREGDRALAELVARRDQASGTDLLGNSIAPKPTTTPGLEESLGGVYSET